MRSSVRSRLAPPNILYNLRILNTLQSRSICTVFVPQFDRAGVLAYVSAGHHGFCLCMPATPPIGLLEAIPIPASGVRPRYRHSRGLVQISKKGAGGTKPTAPSSGDCVYRLTQLQSWRWNVRSIIRWQRRLKREHPTCTEPRNGSHRVRMEGWRQ